MFTKRNVWVINLFLIFVGISLMNFGCGEDEIVGGREVPELTVDVVSKTDCKTGMTVEKGIFDSECIQYTYDGSSILEITHINLSANCCIESLTVAISYSNDTIYVDEGETYDYGPCDCICPYDLNFNITGLPPGKYIISLESPYHHPAIGRFDAPVELSGAGSGEYCKD